VTSSPAVLVVEPTLSAVREGLRDLAVASRGKTFRTIAVLGDLDGTREARMDLGRFLVRLDISVLVAVGDLAGSVHAGAVLEGSWGEESRHVDTPEAAVALLREELLVDDVVLVAGLPMVLHALEGTP